MKTARAIIIVLLQCANYYLPFPAASDMRFGLNGRFVVVSVNNPSWMFYTVCVRVRRQISNSADIPYRSNVIFINDSDIILIIHCVIKKAKQVFTWDYTKVRALR